MPSNVPTSIPGAIGRAPVVSGAPVRGVTWNSVANVSNYLLGKQRTIIPYTGGHAWAQGTTRSFRFRVFRNIYATHRMWLMYIMAPRGTVITFPDLNTVPLQFDYPTTTLLQYFEPVDPRGNAESDLVITFDATTPSTATNLRIDALTCIECPRHSLAINTTDFGVDPDRMRGTFPIYRSLIPPESLGALPRNINTAISGGRRAQFVWARPDDDPFAVSSGTPALVTGAVPVLLDRSIYQGETNVTGATRVRAWCEVGTTGRVRFETGLGSYDVDVSATAAEWHSGTMLMHAEDLTSVDGRRSATWYDTVITAWRTGGAGTMRVSGLGIYGRGS